MTNSNELLATYGKKTEDRVMNAVNSIKNGAKFNGIVYTDKSGKTTVYVDGKVVLLTDQKAYTTEMKELFLDLVSTKTNNRAGLSYGEAYEIGGLDFAEGDDD